MMVVGLLLAQLVLPWPGLDSPLVQPGPTICVGECAGPVVWGQAERGRLVVACDMTSDTCSDGRKITTTRATPVPCETSPGVWEMVPENTGCYGVRGLEAWEAMTSYLAYGAELDRSPWQTVAGGTFEVLPDGYRIYPAVGRANSGLLQAGLAVPAVVESRTLACIVRTHQPAYLRYWISTAQSVSFPAVDTGGRWEVVAGTREVSESSLANIAVGNGPATESPIPFDVKACWFTRTDTPGRACWGGEAPVTCAADRNTVSTEGWPTEAGEVCIGFTLGQEIEGRRLFDSRPGNSLGMLAYVRTGGGISIQTNGVFASFSAGKEWEVGRHHRVCIRRSGGVVSVTRDGVEMVGSREFPEIVWGPTANLGADSAFGNSINGSIRSLTVRSFE